MKDEIIIFGSSPYINEISEHIPKLQQNFTTIGLNMFPVYHPNVDHWFGFDDELIDILRLYYKGQKIHTREALKGHFDILKISNYECFLPIGYIDEDIKDSLVFEKYTITSVIHWCIRSGFKNIYLAGIEMDSENWFHFYELDKSHFSHINDVNKAVKWIYKLQEYANIYQLNPNNTLNLPKKDITDLLRGVK